MATIKGTYYHKGTRPYKYKVTIQDSEGYKPLFFYLEVTNIEGQTQLIDWNIRQSGIEERIRKYIEDLAEKKKGSG